MKVQATSLAARRRPARSRRAPDGGSHDEIDRLPDRYRRPVILCLLEGMSRARSGPRRVVRRLGARPAGPEVTAAHDKSDLPRHRPGGRPRRVSREPLPAAAARPLLAILRTKSAGVALSTLLAVGGTALAIAMLAEDPRQPTSRVATAAQPASPPKAEAQANPESESLASFRGGGPTDQSRATALPPEIAARPVDFRGRVLDPSGNGVAGAQLSLATDAWTVPQPQTVSGNDGSFRIAKTVGDFWRNFATGGSATPYVQAVVLATHDSFGAAWVNLRIVAKDGKPALGGEYPLSLQMVADRPIEGRLLDNQGGPIAGAVVRIDRLYGVPAGDLSPIIDALRRFDLKPYQSSYPRIGPNHFEASTTIPDATTGPDGRFTLKGVGRDRQANLFATGPGMASMSWTVLNRDDAIEVTKAVRARWPHTPKPDGDAAAKAASDPNPGVQVYGPTFDLRVDPARTVRGFVRDAMTGRPVKGAFVYIPYNGAGATSDDRGVYRVIRPDGLDRFRLVAQTPSGAPLLGTARGVQRDERTRRSRRRLRGSPAPASSAAAYPNERTGQPMLAKSKPGLPRAETQWQGGSCVVPSAGRECRGETGSEAGDSSAT